MTSHPIITQFDSLKQFGQRCLTPSQAQRPTLHYWFTHQNLLPRFVRQSPVAMRYLDLLGPLDWDQLLTRETRPNQHERPLSYAAFSAACLVKLDQHFVSMGALRQFLAEQPALTWLLGFVDEAASFSLRGFNAEASLPGQRHLTRMLRILPNSALQLLLDSSVALLQAEFDSPDFQFGETISVDTKHVIAWVRDNNRKAYVTDRYDKTKQPKGDPDCRLGCKRRHNQRISSQEPLPTPLGDAVPANTISVAEFYWGYGSGIAAAKVPGWGEFVLAELTQPFDQSDVSYFYPLMAEVERRLGFRPTFGAFDAAFDAFYVYEYFHRDGEPGFAAVPFADRGGYKRTFDPDGLPLCQAGLPMPLKYTFWSKTTLYEHERGRHVCPLLYPESTDQTCPVDHAQWPKGGCQTTMATSIGARIRYQLDRESETYKQIYNQRTATERINSQATRLGIERPKVRNGQAIANLNTLIYVLINLRALQRIRQRRSE